jgi:hypothetical protein
MGALSDALQTNTGAGLELANAMSATALAMVIKVIGRGVTANLAEKHKCIIARPRNPRRFVRLGAFRIAPTSSMVRCRIEPGPKGTHQTLLPPIPKLGRPISTL